MLRKGRSWTQPKLMRRSSGPAGGDCTRILPSVSRATQTSPQAVIGRAESRGRGRWVAGCRPWWTSEDNHAISATRSEPWRAAAASRQRLMAARCRSPRASWKSRLEGAAWIRRGTPQQVKREIRRCVHCGAAQTAPLGWPAHAARWVPVADPEAVGGTPIGVAVPLWWVRPLSTWPLGTASRARIPA